MGSQVSRDFVLPPLAEVPHPLSRGLCFLVFTESPALLLHSTAALGPELGQEKDAPGACAHCCCFRASLSGRRLLDMDF